LNDLYSSNNSELDTVIKEVKQELRVLFLKRKDIIIKLGNEYEKLVVNPESVCEEIKLALHEEIVDLTISSRDIERYCPDKWKKKTKPQKNDKLSFLTKTEGQEKEEHMTIAIDTQGSPADELKLIGPKSQTCIKERNCDLETQELSTNIQSNTINLDSCPNCKKPLLENQRIHHEKDIKIKELEDEREQVCHALNIKSAENAGMQAQINHLNKKLQEKDENDVDVSSSSNAHHQLESSQIVDLEFALQYEEVLRYVRSRLKISGILGSLWFNCSLHKRTFRIVSAYPGSIIERKSMANKENNRNE
jgi:hypothetical protein